MRFETTGLEGSWLIEPSPYRDERGSFSRIYCEDAFQRQGLASRFPQHSIAVTSRRGTIRGLHLQGEPHQETKLVRCVSGAVYNVIVDLRPQSATFGQWRGYELTAENGLQLYLPKGFAQGCQSLTDDAGVLYMISEAFVPGVLTGVRYDDAALAIDWPLPVSLVLERDCNWPDVSTFRRGSRSVKLRSSGTARRSRRSVLLTT